MNKTNHMTASSVQDAWNKVDRIFPTDYDKDESASRIAGYPIYRSSVDYCNCICDLGSRLEVNFSDGRTVNIWIEDTAEKIRKSLAEVTRKLYPL